MNAQDLLLMGIVSAAIAAAAWIGDHVRLRRRNLDRVGFMPWTAIFFWATLAAVLLLGVGGIGWLRA
jgi:hypothetical protein